MKKNKIFLIILIIIIIIEICTAVILIRRKNIDKNKIMSPTAEEHIGHQDGELTIENYSELLSYQVGSISKADIINILREYVTGVLPVAYSSIDSSENNLKIAYVNNMNSFKKCGINNSSELKNLIKQMKNTKENINFEKYKSAKFVGTEYDGKYFVIKAEVTYVNYRKIIVKIKYDDKTAKLAEFVENN